MSPERQLLVDVTVLAQHDDRSGVQRVVRNVLHTLQASPPPGWAVVPVRDAGGHYAYVGSADIEGESAPIAVREGDIFLGLDLAPNNIPGNLDLLRSLRQHGVRMVFVVYDLLPVRQPENFIDGAAPWFANWLASVAQLADGLVCISKAVADDLLDWLDEHPAPHPGTLQVGYFHLGADLDPQVDAQDSLSDAEATLLAALGQRPGFLMVGTLEPRKRQALALDACEALWRDGLDVNLVLVGRQGWMVEQLAARLQQHAELGKRLFWLERAGDSALRRLYAESAALLSVSSGEGFGLPLIEAAQHGLAVIVQDLPVFREVAGAHAYYVDAADGDDLAAQLRRWLDLREQGAAPTSNAMPWMTWKDSSAQLLSVILDDAWYRQASTRLI